MLVLQYFIKQFLNHLRNIRSYKKKPVLTLNISSSGIWMVMLERLMLLHHVLDAPSSNSYCRPTQTIMLAIKIFLEKPA